MSLSRPSSLVRPFSRTPELSHAQGVIDRLHGCSGVLDEQGRYAYYGHAGGFPAYENQRAAWDAGCGPDNADPEHR